MVVEWWWMWWWCLMILLLKEIGLVGWIWVGVLDLGLGDLGVIFIVLILSIDGLIIFKDNFERKENEN